MFAYIKNNQIFTTAIEKLSEESLEQIGEKEENFTILEYSNEIKNPVLSAISWLDPSKKLYKIIEQKSEESEAEKFARIFETLRTAERLDKSLLEGIEFNDEQIGNLILARVFDNNPHGQTALQTKVIAMLMAKKENPELLAEILQKMEKINEVRVFFNLSPITL